ncbi:MAG: xanthine dehydrogenase family protein subunit M [Acidobacteriota bacterium]|nr:xanthine dehydrogenase family protein subunit M [Blastocatellia bacterium]MDW8240852.1 xanthine dehydrogenase family protein subunit M [Acidobacteriota bacterium]
MIPTPFEYLKPSTLAEALNLLATHGEQAKLLAGGHSLIPLMKFRLASPHYLIDLGGIADLRYISADGDQIAIGAMTTHHAIESSALLKHSCPLLSEAAAAIGDVQVRNCGTIGGSLAHADPAGDFPAAVLALSARLKAVSSRGERWIHSDDFFIGLLTTALQSDEILTEIRVPVDPPRTGAAYLKVPQPASGFALCGVAARVTVDAQQVCQSVAIGITGVGPTAYRARAVEQQLQGQTLDDAVISAAAEHAVDGVDPSEDIHASSEYRAHLAKVYTQRAIQTALSRVP